MDNKITSTTWSVAASPEDGSLTLMLHVIDEHGATDTVSHKMTVSQTFSLIATLASMAEQLGA